MEHKAGVSQKSLVPAGRRQTVVTATRGRSSHERIAMVRRGSRRSVADSAEDPERDAAYDPDFVRVKQATDTADTGSNGEIISRGVASWYSADRYNKRTSSGAMFDENAMTAAHPWLPMGTRVRVTVEGSRESIVVTINDRQGSKTRVIDLSKGAARELGILGRGVARVTLTRS